MVDVPHGVELVPERQERFDTTRDDGDRVEELVMHGNRERAPGISAEKDFECFLEASIRRSVVQYKRDIAPEGIEQVEVPLRLVRALARRHLVPFRIVVEPLQPNGTGRAKEDRAWWYGEKSRFWKLAFVRIPFRPFFRLGFYLAPTRWAIAKQEGWKQQGGCGRFGGHGG